MPILNDTYEDLIADPALIDTHELALEIISYLENEISNIESQIKTAETIKAFRDPVWLKRATYAMCLKRHKLTRVYNRDKEIRQVLRATQLQHEEEIKLLKKRAEVVRQERLLVEAENIRTQKKITYENILKDKMDTAQRARESKIRLLEMYEKTGVKIESS